MPIMQTENECGDGTNSWAYAWYVADLLCHYLTHCSRVYAYWNMVLETKGLSTWGWQQNSLFTVDPGQGTLTRNPEYYIFRHFTSCIRPGAKRVILKGPWSAYSVAFENADGSTAIILRNPLPGESTVNIRGGSKEIAVSLPPASLSTIILR
jgi:glucosylceramidase